MGPAVDSHKARSCIEASLLNHTKREAAEPTAFEAGGHINWKKRNSLRTNDITRNRVDISM